MKAPPSGTRAAASTSRPSRATWASLAFISVLSLVLRYPVGSEHGVDGFTFHALAGVILQTGSMGWLVTPASYLGLAPFSYPPAVSVSIAALSGISGLNLEWSIAVYSLLIGLLVTWTSFLFGRALFGRDSLALVVSLLVSSAGGVLAFTNWNLSTRGTFLAIVPLVLALLVKSLQARRIGSDGRLLALGLASFTLLFVHLFWLLFFPLLGATFFLYQIARTEDRLLRHSETEAKRKRVILLTHTLLATVLLAALYQNITDLFTLTNFPNLGGGLITNNIFTRIGVQYGTQVGVAILVLPMGAWALVRTPERARRYILSSLAVSFLPITTDPIYGILIAIPVVLAICTAGMAYWGRKRRRVGAPAWIRREMIVGVLLATFLAAPLVVTIPRTTAIACGQSGYLDDHAYDAGLFLRYLNPDSNFTFAWDDPLNAARLEAVSGRPSVEPILSIGDLAYPWLARRNKIQLMPSGNLISSLIVQQQVLSAKDWILGPSQQYGYFVGKHMALLDNNAPGSPTARSIMVSYGTQYAVQICPDKGSIFFQDLEAGNYEIYANDVQHIYFTAT